jgi:hypothetical protein
VSALPLVSSWTSEGTKAIRGRKVYFEKLPILLPVPGATVALDPDAIDRAWRSADVRVTYPGRHLAGLGAMAPFVRLEIGSARVTPFVPRDMTSFVHEKLAAGGQLGTFTDNRPKAVKCVHLPTLADYADVRALADDMVTRRPKQIEALPSSEDPAFASGGGRRWDAIRAAHAAIAPMFWGPRISLEDACGTIRDWIARNL